MSEFMESYITVKDESEFEYEDRKSVFIGKARPVKTEAEALEFLSCVKKQYPDARHHVYAYVLRENSIMRFSDDREPQGTAGMPVLDVIRKNSCTDVAIVVTRYFGGTLLGTGGLVRAYTSAAAGALNAATVITYDTYIEAEFSLSYSDYQKVTVPISQSGFREKGTEYTDLVTISGSILKTSLQKLKDEIIQITAGRADIKIIGEKYDF